MIEVVNTKVRNANKYEEIISETSKSSRDRNKVKNSRGDKVIPRKYHVSEEVLESLIKNQEKTGKFQNPYARKGVSSSLVQALINLGENRSHRFIDVKNEMKRIMSNEYNKDGKSLWDLFYNKKSNNKSDLSIWDANTRIEKTASMLQRLGGHHPYGYKLKQLCACIDLLPSTDPLLENKYNIRLNTSFSSPDQVQPVKPAGKKKKIK